jgi:hypothetical protein
VTTLSSNSLLRVRAQTLLVTRGRTKESKAAYGLPLIVCVSPKWPKMGQKDKKMKKNTFFCKNIWIVTKK